MVDPESSGAEQRSVALLAPPGISGESALGGLLLPTLRLAGLFVVPLPAHVCENSGSLYLAAELAQGLLEVLSFGDLNLQNSLTPSGTRLARDTMSRAYVSVSAVQNSVCAGRLPTRDRKVGPVEHDARVSGGPGQRRKVKRAARRWRICSFRVCNFGLEPAV